MDNKLLLWEAMSLICRPIHAVCRGVIEFDFMLLQAL